MAAAAAAATISQGMGSQSSENSTCKTASITLAAPHAGTISTLRGFPLNDRWEIGDQLQKEKQKHAIVYLVLDKAGLPVQNLEAHAFALDDTQPKIRKHRLRCIKRMTHRTELEIKLRDAVLVVISTAPTTDDPVSEKNEATDEPVGIQAGSKYDGRVATKTPYKQELVRTRQRERRRAKRSGKVDQHLETADSREKRTETSTVDEETDFAGFLTLVWILFDETGTMKEEIPTEHQDLVKKMGGDPLYNSSEKYLKQTAIELESLADMELYLKVKRGETTFLRRHLARVASAEKYHQEKLDTLDQEQTQCQENSEEWREIEYGLKAEAALELDIVLHAKTVLPRILASQKTRIRSIERKRARALEKLASAELREKRDALVHNVALYEAYTQTAFPLSHARADLLNHWEEAKIALAAFDHRD